MVPDPNPSDSDVLDPRHPSKLAAAEQMCSIDGNVDVRPALYNHNRCGQRSIPDPSNPSSEVRPQGLKQGETLENDTVLACSCVLFAVDYCVYVYI